MNVNDLKKVIKTRFQGILEKDAYGETTFFYNPDKKLKNGVYFLTIKQSNGPNDIASKLDRDGIYRLSFNPGKDNYQKLFGQSPKRPSKGKVVDLNYDFTELDKLLPHPVYAWMGWVNILSPSELTIEKVKNLLDKSYENAKKKYAIRIRQK